jgi:hypothetical protein
MTFCQIALPSKYHWFVELSSDVATSIRLLQEELSRRQCAGDLTMRFHSTNLCWQGTGVELLQDEHILGLQGGRCIVDDAPIYG